MKTITALLWLGLALLRSHAGGTNTVTTCAPGSFYHGDGLGMNILVTISTNQKYTAQWSDCMGSCGTAAGSWSNATGMLHLTPTNETGMFRSHQIRVLRVQNATNLVVVNSSKALEGKTFSSPPCITKRTRTKRRSAISDPLRGPEKAQR